ncbi:MarR family winged helix-turn-helix transcriptional regulator [Candidatus Aciduliprofundum boonei]|uniref:Transcriptional regulator PadR family protein n=1 Tax=Aciduliprofundum boonei (strain DSM 19572 / T469) TaxID=439481 RepID=D3T9T3_ACIB4|nr:MarR family transcriptional regulator [Candidatus Aciduliprofundum boonei]ADD08862.1 transcriptional regulator PadR family protein [Aciduliprofundum boonei T469]HII55615.1 winged helix DNA-binding protein [Candidatus Aciduliprofundum boonei]
MDAKLLAFLKDGKYRIKTLELLYKKPRLSSELATLLNINRASMSRILSDLKKKDLVESTSDGTRTVVYTITEKGKKCLEELK